jgi:hypothetical protein
VLRVDAQRRLHCEVLSKDSLEPEPIALILERPTADKGSSGGQQPGAPQVSVEDLVVCDISAQDGKGLALVSTESHGLLIAGIFDGESPGDDGDDDEPSSFGQGGQTLPLRFAHHVPGSVLSLGSVVTSMAVAKSFCVAVVLDIATGCSRVAGRGFTSSGALGKAAARSGTSSTSSLAVMANVSFPKHAQLPQLPFSAYEEFFAAFRWLVELDALCVTAAYAGNSLALFNTARGLYAIGKLNDQQKFETPTLVLEWLRPGTVPRSVAFTDSAVFCLLDGSTMFCLQRSAGFLPVPQFLEKLPEPVAFMCSAADHVVLVGEKTQSLYGWGNAAFGQLGRSNGPCRVSAPAPIVPLTALKDDQQVASVHCFGFRTILGLQSGSQLARSFITVGKKL